MASNFTSRSIKQFRYWRIRARAGEPNRNNFGTLDFAESTLFTTLREDAVLGLTRELAQGVCDKKGPRGR